MLETKTSFEVLIKRGIGELYHTLKLEDFQGDPLAKALTKEYIDNLSKFLNQGLGIYAWGKPGTGKTFLMVEILKQVLRTPKKNGSYLEARKTSLGEIIHYFTNTWYGRESVQVFEADLINVDVLLIDDVEKTYVSEGSRPLLVSAMDKVLRTRVERKRPVLITSNESPASLSIIFGEPISSLLAGHCRVIQVQGNDYRKEDKAKDKWERTLNGS